MKSSSCCTWSPSQFSHLVFLQSPITKVTCPAYLSHPTFLFLQRLQLLNPMSIVPNLSILYSRNSLPKLIYFLLKSPQLLTQQNWVKSIQLSHPYSFILSNLNDYNNNKRLINSTNIKNNLEIVKN